MNEVGICAHLDQYECKAAMSPLTNNLSTILIFALFFGVVYIGFRQRKNLGHLILHYCGKVTPAPERRLVELAILLAGRKRAWSKTELLADLAYSRHADRPSARRTRLYHAADLIRGAAMMRARDIYTALSAPWAKLRWVSSPGVPAMLTALIMAIYFFATGCGFTAVIDHIQDICDAGGITGLIELGVRQVQRYRSS